MYTKRSLFHLFTALLIFASLLLLAQPVNAAPSLQVPDIQLLSTDPSIGWNTFLGGTGSVSGGDGTLGVATDSSGNIYVTGFSNSSWGSPVRAYTNPGTDAFVAKLDPSGNLVWNTFLGGSQSDLGVGITVDTGGNVYVTGSTADSSGNAWGCAVDCTVRDISGGNANDAFVAKLDSSGNLVWNSFLGGSGPYPQANDNGKGITVDAHGEVYVTGWSSAAWGCTTSCTKRAYTPGGTSANDAFVARLNGTSGVLGWNTFLGSSGLDGGEAIVAYGSGVYVTGESGDTWGTPLQAINANHSDFFTDAFIAKITTSGTLTWSTFMGGTGKEIGYGIALDSSGNPYIAGQANSSWGSPVRALQQQDGFVAELDPSGSMIWNTYLGADTINGGGLDDARGIALDSSDNIFVVGNGNDTWESPVRAFTTESPMKNDVYVAMLNSSGTLLHNTFLGTTGNDNGYSIGVDPGGNAYAGGNSPASWGSPVRAFSSTIASPQNSFVAKVDFTPPTVSSSVRANTNPTARASVDFTVTFSEAVIGVDTSDFSLVTTGVSGAAISGVSGSGATYTVTVNTGSKDGTIHLNVLNNGSIQDPAENALSSAFSSGETYTVNKTLTFTSGSGKDGWVLESSETSGQGGTLNSTATTFRLGDDAANKQYRGILSFNTSSIPDTAVITAVTLKVKKQGVTGGGNPVTTFNGFMVDIKKGFFGTTALQIGDFQAAASKTLGPFTPSLVSGLYSINLTSGKASINKLSTNSGLTQIRLRFKLDDNNNAVANYLSLYTGETGAASRPQLVIKYYVP